MQRRHVLRKLREHSKTACEQWRDANQRVILAAMKLSVFIPILPRTSRRMMGIYTMEFLALIHVNLSHLQVPENDLFHVQVAGLTVRQFTLTDSSRQIGL